MLLEREGALAALHAALVRVRDGGAGELVSVAGEAGVGKTSLLRAFLDTVAGPVWWGGCDPLRNPRPLGPLVDIAATAGGELLAAVSAGADRTELFSATLRAVHGPVVVVVEDAHWADEATLDLLTYLGRRLAGTSALLVISYRDDELARSHPLRTVLGELGLRAEQRVRLTALSLPSVRALVGNRDLDAAVLHRLTAGNPFFVTEYLAAEPDDADELAPLRATVPGSVADAVLARLGRLPEPAQRCLSACAVHPGRVGLDLVAALAGEDADAVDDCVEHGLLLSFPDGLAFRHELARLAVLDSLPPARRRSLHRRALTALTPLTTADVAWTAHHAEQADDPAAILRFAPLAAAAAGAVGASRVMAGHLAAAVRYGDRLPPTEYAALLQQYAAACYSTGAMPESITAYEQAVAQWRAVGDPVREGRALSELSGPLVQCGRQQDAVEAVNRACARLEPGGPSADLAYAYTRLCGMHMLAREFDEARRWAIRAAAMAADLARPDQLAAALIQGGVTRLMSGTDENADELRRGIELAREQRMPETVLLGLSQLGSGAGEIHRYDLAVPALREAVDWAADRQMSEEYPLAWLARCELDLGHWDEAGRLATRLVRGSTGSDIARFVALTVLGRLRARRGDPEVWSALDEAVEIAERTGHLQRLWPVAAARAEAAWIGGRLVEEVPALQHAYRLAEQLAYPWAVGELGFWLWRAGRLDRPAAASARPFRLQVDAQADAAGQAWAELGCPYESALARAESADVEVVRSAFAALDDLGAQAVLARVATHLRELGGTVPRRASAPTRAHPAGLTRREAEIAALLAQSLTNKEISARLYISAKTVEHHVAAVLTKLGLSSRRELRGVELLPKD